MKGMVLCFSRKSVKCSGIEVLKLEFQFSKKKKIHYSIPVVILFLHNEYVLFIKWVKLTQKS